MEYSHLLDMADKTQDPYMRMVYACKQAHAHSPLPSLCVFKLCVPLVLVWLISINKMSQQQHGLYLCIMLTNVHGNRSIQSSVKLTR